MLSASDSLLFECPICFRDFADVDPTTFACGHSCCMFDAQKLKVCHMCEAAIPSSSNLSVNIMMRDIAKRFRAPSQSNSVSLSMQCEESLSVSVDKDCSVTESNSESICGKKKKKRSKSKSPKVSVAIASLSSVSSEGSTVGSDAATERTESVCSFAPEQQNLEEHCSYLLAPHLLPPYEVKAVSGLDGTTSTNLECCFCSVTAIALLIQRFLRDSAQPSRLVLGGNTLEEGLLLVLSAVKSVRVRLSTGQTATEPLPCLVVQFAHHVFSDTSCEEDALFLQEVGARGQAITYKASRRELHYFKGVLEDNATRTMTLPPVTASQCCQPGCTAKGTLVCSRCKCSSYCSREHQVTHWKSSHKRECSEKAFTAKSSSSSSSSSGGCGQFRQQNIVSFVSNI